MRILLIEDDRKIASFISKGLSGAGMTVDSAYDGVKGLDLALSEPYDAAVIDIMLPGLDGLSIIQRMRTEGVKTPVIILSAKRSVEDRVKGLELGSDDYLVKPFSFSELLARIHALIRRRAAVRPQAPVLTARDCAVDLITRRVTKGGDEIDLQPKEFALLEYLVRNKGRVVSKSMILEHVWGYDFDPQTNVVDVLVCRLRNKLKNRGVPGLIETIRGFGYVIRAD